MIKTLVIKWNPELAKYSEFTNKACNIVKQKTDIDLPLIVTKVFVGVGNIIVNHHEKVFYTINRICKPLYDYIKTIFMYQ